MTRTVQRRTVNRVHRVKVLPRGRGNDGSNVDRRSIESLRSKSLRDTQNAEISLRLLKRDSEARDHLRGMVRVNRDHPSPKFASICLDSSHPLFSKKIVHLPFAVENLDGSKLFRATARRTDRFLVLWVVKSACSRIYVGDCEAIPRLGPNSIRLVHEGTPRKCLFRELYEPNGKPRHIEHRFV